MVCNLAIVSHAIFCWLPSEPLHDSESHNIMLIIYKKKWPSEHLKWQMILRRVTILFIRTVSLKLSIQGKALYIVAILVKAHILGLGINRR